MLCPCWSAWQAHYDLWAEENKVLKVIVKRCEEIGDNYFMRFEWFLDEAMPLLCADDEKAYMAHISKRLRNSRGYSGLVKC